MGSWSGDGIASVAHRLPGRCGAACPWGGAELEDEDFDVLKAAVGWRGKMCTTRTGSVGGADVPEVVVHPSTESEHGLAHIMLVASGTLDGIDDVV